MLYDKRNQELLERDTALLKKLEKETDEFIREQMKLFHLEYERHTNMNQLDGQLSELEGKSSAFSRSVKKTTKKLKDKYYRTLFFILFIVLVLLTIGYLTRR